MGMSQQQRDYVDATFSMLSRRVNELEAKVTALEDRCIELHQENLALKHRNGLK